MYPKAAIIKTSIDIEKWNGEPRNSYIRTFKLISDKYAESTQCSKVVSPDVSYLFNSLNQ